MTAPMTTAANDYLRLRRALGHRLEWDGRLLTAFAQHLDSRGVTRLTTSDALAWSATSTTGAAGSVAHRMTLIRGFARYLAAFDPATEIPAPELCPSRVIRRVPYIFTSEQIDALITAATELTPRLRAMTFMTLIGLMAATGLRTSEAFRLEVADVDIRDSLLLVRCSKFGKTRHLPLHPSTVTALRRYLDERGACPTTVLFVGADRQLLHRNNEPAATFRRLLADVGITLTAGRRPPRLHDLRHTFAVTTLRDWHAAGVDVEAQLAVLSTYLGHLNPAYTYWYLQAVPELMTVLGQRVDTYLTAGGAW
jgi:integrase/recombinase XerD